MSQPENESQASQQPHDVTFADSEKWFPFKSKAEMLLYVFMNSTSHTVSDEVVKFVLFMLEQFGVQDLPSLSTLKDKQFGCFCWEDMIAKGKDKDNIPLWTLKPSAILKLMIANPHISKSVIRHPQNSDSIEHPTQAKKWREELEFSGTSETGSPVVNLPLNLFLDDTATHRSKQWLPLHCIQMQLAGLPLKERKKLGSVKFLGASEKVDIMDVARVIVDDIKELESTGVESFDAYNQRNCIVKSSLNVIVADYNILSHCCNHLGAASTKYCPRCHADSDHFMSIGRERSPRETKQTIERLNLKSNENEKKRLRKRKGVKEHENVFWDVLNPHRDIPVGLLHLIPLGIAKDLVIHITEQQREEVKLKMKCHLESLRPGSQFQDFFKYIRSKQGKHFKGYLQIAPLNMCFAGVPRKYVQMITCLAKIQKNLNKTSFSVVDINELREDIRHFHQMIHVNIPAFKKKPKVHLLLHMLQDILRHGPPRAYEEDQYEKNHGTIRNVIFTQNQKARSRDTSIKFAKSYLCTHVISGGFVQDGQTWRESSPAVISLGKSRPVMKYFGIEESNQKNPGTISLLKRNKKGNTITETKDEDTILQAVVTLNMPDQNLQQYSIKRGRAVTTKQQELVHSGEWVKYLDAANNECYGIFREGIILLPKRGSAVLIAVIQKSASTLRIKAECPQYHLASTKDVVRSVKIVEKVEMVHDCGFGCRIVEKSRTERVEQEEINRKSLYLNHDLSNKTYLLNILKF